MASLADPAALTFRLRELTAELHREASDLGGDLPRMVALADDISELADRVAVVLERTNAALEAALDEWPLAASVPESQAERGSWRAVAQAFRRVWTHARRLSSLRRRLRWADDVPRQPGPWRPQRPYPELLLIF